MADARPARPTPTDFEVEGNRLTVLADGEERLAALLALIAGAREQLRILYYIFEDAASGCAVRDALLEACARGVKVAILVDGFGSDAASDAFFQPLVDSDCRFRRFAFEAGITFVFAPCFFPPVGNKFVHDALARMLCFPLACEGPYLLQRHLGRDEVKLAVHDLGRHHISRPDHDRCAHFGGDDDTSGGVDLQQHVADRRKFAGVVAEGLSLFCEAFPGGHGTISCHNLHNMAFLVRNGKIFTTCQIVTPPPSSPVRSASA